MRGQDKIEKLFMMYEKPLYYYALKMLGDEQKSEDVVQITFVKLIENVGNIGELESRESRGYIYVILKNTIKDELRKKNKIETVEKPLDENVYNIGEKSKPLDSKIVELAFSGLISDYVDQLNEAEQQVLYLKYIMDLNNEEIADKLNLESPGAAQKRIERARKRILVLSLAKGGECKNG